MRRLRRRLLFGAAAIAVIVGYNESTEAGAAMTEPAPASVPGRFPWQGPPTEEGGCWLDGEWFANGTVYSEVDWQTGESVSWRCVDGFWVLIDSGKDDDKPEVATKGFF